MVCLMKIRKENWGHWAKHIKAMKWIKPDKSVNLTKTSLSTNH